MNCHGLPPSGVRASYAGARELPGTASNTGLRSSCAIRPRALTVWRAGRGAQGQRAQRVLSRCERPKGLPPGATNSKRPTAGDSSRALGLFLRRHPDLKGCLAEQQIPRATRFTHGHHTTRSRGGGGPTHAGRDHRRGGARGGGAAPNRVCDESGSTGAARRPQRLHGPELRAFVAAALRRAGKPLRRQHAGAPCRVTASWRLPSRGRPALRKSSNTVRRLAEPRSGAQVLRKDAVGAPTACLGPYWTMLVFVTFPLAVGCPALVAGFWCGRVHLGIQLASFSPRRTRL